MRVHVINGPVNDYRGNIDLGQSRQSSFYRRIAWIACSVSHAVAIRMNNHLDKVGIVEGGRRAAIGRVVKGPSRRPQSPQQSPKFATPLSETFAPAFGLKIVLVPEPSSCSGSAGLPALAISWI